MLLGWIVGLVKSTGTAGTRRRATCQVVETEQTPLRPMRDLDGDRPHRMRRAAPWHSLPPCRVPAVSEVAESSGAAARISPCAGRRPRPSRRTTPAPCQTAGPAVRRVVRQRSEERRYPGRRVPGHGGICRSERDGCTERAMLRPEPHQRGADGWARRATASSGVTPPYAARRFPVRWTSPF